MKKKTSGWKGLVLGLVLSVFLTAGMANAFQPGPMLTFTFDDGSRPIYDKALPILSNAGLKAVFFGETGPLNAAESWVMTWDEVRKLQDVYGWEIGSHSITHPYLTAVSDEQLLQELEGSKQDFVNHGINVKGFATPYGDWDTTRVLPAIAKYYEWHRAAWGGANSWPYNDYQIMVLEPANPNSFLTPAQVIQKIDEAVGNRQWLVLLFHEVVDGAALAYEYNVNDFKQIVDYVAEHSNNNNLNVVTISEALMLSKNGNLIANPSFSTLDHNQWALYWDRSGNVNIDQNAQGNFPEPENALKIIGGAEAQDAWSGPVRVSWWAEYLLKMFQSVQDLTSGGWAIWVDEFNDQGYYLGGQWLGGNYANFFGIRYYSYSPNSSAVEWVSLVIFTEEGSNLTLFIDSVEFKKVRQIRHRFWTFWE